MKKFFLCIVVSLMMILGGSIPAHAAYTPIKGGTFSFNHFLIMHDYVFVPPITFSCTIRPGTKQGTIDPGPTGATINNVVYDYTSTTYDTPQGTDDVMLDEEEKYARSTITVDLRNVTFTAPGTYRYIISGTKTGASDGITTSPDLFLDVYVINDGVDTLKVSSTFLHLTTATEKVNSVQDKFHTNDLRVLNYVTGNQGDTTKEFTYTLIVDGGTPEKKYLLRVVGEGTIGRMISSQERVTFTLKHNERARIHGLSPNDKYTITQDSYLADGYTTNYSLNDGEKINSLTTGEKTMGNITNTNAYYNHKASDEPATGIILNRLPYIIMIALVVGFGSLFFFKRRLKMNNK